MIQFDRSQHRARYHAIAPAEIADPTDAEPSLLEVDDSDVEMLQQQGWLIIARPSSGSGLR